MVTPLEPVSLRLRGLAGMGQKAKVDLTSAAPARLILPYSAAISTLDVRMQAKGTLERSAEILPYHPIASSSRDDSTPRCLQPVVVMVLSPAA